MLGLVLIALALAGLTLRGLQPRHQPDRQKFCFAEWCVTPIAIRSDSRSITVQVRVSSEARMRTQRPDHPQAWLRGADSNLIGGPQPALGRAIGPGAAYLATLTFPIAPGSGCMDFTVAEGGWPPFLGLGYSPSPFTERVVWRLCLTS